MDSLKLKTINIRDKIHITQSILNNLKNRNKLKQTGNTAYISPYLSSQIEKDKR